VGGEGIIGVAGEIVGVKGVQNVPDIKASLGEEGAEVGVTALRGGALGYGASDDGHSQNQGKGQGDRDQGDAEDADKLIACHGSCRPF
jgi:hypothetical protein